MRSHLAKLNFRGEDVFKPCSALSGGELARLRFAEILLEKPNLLFLDEPTNHLDIYTRESLGAALASYEGTLVLVTHDRYLMNSLACPILFIENGKTSLYEDYDAMMHRGAVPPEKNIAPEKTASAGKAAYGKDIDAARVCGTYAMSWTIPVFIRTRSWPNGKGLWKNRKLTSRKTTNNTIQVCPGRIQRPGHFWF